MCFFCPPENEEEESTSVNPALFRISGRDGLYYEKLKWINKYSRRGKVVKEICPTHLVKMYDPDNQRSKKEAHLIYLICPEHQ